MRIDFYQLSRDLPEQVVALLASKVLGTGERLLVVSDDLAQHEAISKALWDKPLNPNKQSAFLAHGAAGGPHDARQPILLSDNCPAAENAANGAKMAILADGQWREEASGFQRVLLLFGADQTMRARDLWRELSAKDGNDLHIFKQTEGGAWREGR